MSEIGKYIDQAVNSGLSRRLKELGFRKNIRIFYVRDAEYTKIVEVRAGHYDLPHAVHFEVMLGVFFPDVAQLLEKPSLKRLPRYQQCIIWTSLGRLAFDATQRKEDIWYDIDLNLPTDLKALARKIEDEWEKYGHSWMNRVTDPEEAAKELSHYHLYIMAAAIYLAKGFREKASEQILLDIASRPGVESWAKKWAERHDLI